MGPLPDLRGVFATLMIFALLGVLALIAGAGFLVWWLLTHVTITVV